MSRSFSRLFKIFSPKNYEPSSSSSLDIIYVKTVSLIYVVGIFGHCAYAFGTAETKSIKIKDKYTFDRNGFTEFMVIDENNKHYNINNSVWYWKWDSIEDWTKLDINKQISIKYYGWRVPVFGLFPNIIMTTHDNVSLTNVPVNTKIIETDYDIEHKLTNQQKALQLIDKDEEKSLQLIDKDEENINLMSNPYYYLHP